MGDPALHQRYTTRVHAPPQTRLPTRKSAMAAAAEAKRAAEAEARAREQHWRVRVESAKHRLYLYLRGYMAWMSVLKRKRRG